MKRILIVGAFTVLATGIIVTLNARPTKYIGNLTLRNIEALSFIDNDGHDVTVPCTEQKREKCTEKFYDANGNYVGTETFKNRVRTN